MVLEGSYTLLTHGIDLSQITKRPSFIPQYSTDDSITLPSPCPPSYTLGVSNWVVIATLRLSISNTGSSDVHNEQPASTNENQFGISILSMNEYYELRLRTQSKQNPHMHPSNKTTIQHIPSRVQRHLREDHRSRSIVTPDIFSILVGINSQNRKVFCICVLLDSKICS